MAWVGSRMPTDGCGGVKLSCRCRAPLGSPWARGLLPLAAFHWPPLPGSTSALQPVRSTEDGGGAGVASHTVEKQSFDEHGSTTTYSTVYELPAPGAGLSLSRELDKTSLGYPRWIAIHGHWHTRNTVEKGGGGTHATTLRALEMTEGEVALSAIYLHLFGGGGGGCSGFLGWVPTYLLTYLTE